MNWLKGFVAYIKAAFAKVGTLFGGLAALFSWVKLPALPAFKLPSWLAVVWTWVCWAVGGLWRSFWAVWGNPLTYPIIGAVAFLAFSVGHHEGRKGGLGVAVTYEARMKALAAANRNLADNLATALKANAELVKATPAMVAPVPAKPPVDTPAKRVKKIKETPKATGWPAWLP